MTTAKTNLIQDGASRTLHSVARLGTAREGPMGGMACLVAGNTLDESGCHSLIVSMSVSQGAQALAWPLNLYSHGAEQLTSSCHKNLPSEGGSDTGDRRYRGVGRDRAK